MSNEARQSTIEYILGMRDMFKEKGAEKPVKPKPKTPFEEACERAAAQQTDEEEKLKGQFVPAPNAPGAMAQMLGNEESVQELPTVINEIIADLKTKGYYETRIVHWGIPGSFGYNDFDKRTQVIAKWFEKNMPFVTYQRQAEDYGKYMGIRYVVPYKFRLCGGPGDGQLIEGNQANIEKGFIEMGLNTDDGRYWLCRYRIFKEFFVDEDGEWTAEFESKEEDLPF